MRVKFIFHNVFVLAVKMKNYNIYIYIYIGYLMSRRCAIYNIQRKEYFIK